MFHCKCTAAIVCYYLLGTAPTLNTCAANKRLRISGFYSSNQTLFQPARTNFTASFTIVILQITENYFITLDIFYWPPLRQLEMQISF